ncbi:hypothetical protein Tco_0419456, partial [Tanacetum coccineum]
MIDGNGPKWLFDIDSLTQSMNYVPVVVGTISIESAGSQGELNTSTSTQKEEISQDCIVNTSSSYKLDSPKDMFKLGASHTLETTHVEFFSDEDEPEVDLEKPLVKDGDADNV